MMTEDEEIQYLREKQEAVKQRVNRPYIEKLKDPRWQKKRLIILQRDNWTCQKCGSKEKCLNVHHVFYEPCREPWEHKDENLITLCEGCHHLEGMRVSPGKNIDSMDSLLDWWVVLNNPMGAIAGFPWHIEQLERYLRDRPCKDWRIIGIFPSCEEASWACDEFEKRLCRKLKKRLRKQTG
jgi:hypothetical protein